MKKSELRHHPNLSHTWGVVLARCMWTLVGQMENSLVVYCPILKVGHIPIYSCSILLLLSSKNCKLSHWSCILHFSLRNPLNPIWQRISCENFFSVTLCRRLYNVQLWEMKWRVSDGGSSWGKPFFWPSFLKTSLISHPCHVMLHYCKKISHISCGFSKFNQTAWPLPWCGEESDAAVGE